MKIFRITRSLIKPLYLICLCTSVAGLLGCSQLGVGQAEYSCRGMPDGVKCLSASEVYHLTEEEELAQREVESFNITHQTAMTAQLAVAPAERTFFNHQPALIEPIRTEAKIMRIWVTPWEDDEGDLHLGEFILTEIEPPRWGIGQI